MIGVEHDRTPPRDGLQAGSIESLAELAQALRQLRRRHARGRNDSVLTYRELATRTGYAYGLIAEYFSGKVLPPTDRFDVLVQLLGANSVEQGALASARDRIEERRHARRPTRTRPQELPAEVANFVGRGPELAALDSHLLPLDRRRTVPIAVVSGTGGVGKTALAGHWAHRAGRRQFPDGCLYLDLHGYDQREPVASAEALASLLRRLDVLRIPHELDERAALYRSTLAGRQLLLVLDNARDAAQVRPLLPGESGCAVLVTSRDTLAGLVARHGAHRIELGRLPVADAIDLLLALLGTRERLEPETMRILAERCARLPLALRLVAELATNRPDTPIGELIDELADEKRKLSLLGAGGDLQTSARAVFSWSYRQLQPPAARMFRLLGLLPGPDLDPPTAAALAAEDPGTADDLLRTLRQANLLESRSAGRYALHDLLRTYAESLASAHETCGSRNAALHRLIQYQVHTATQAVETAYSDGRQPRPGPPSPFGDAAAALSWLAAERANLLATLNRSDRPGWPGPASQLAEPLFRHLLSSGRFDDALAVSQRQREHAGAVGDLAGESDALSKLGIVSRIQGRLDAAVEHHRRALDIARQLGDPIREIRSLNLAGGVLHRVGYLTCAASYYLEALHVARSANAAAAQAESLANLGLAYRGLARYGDARACIRQALGRTGASSATVARAWQTLGEIQLGLGRNHAARRLFQRALLLYRQVHDRTREADALSDLAVAHRGVGNHQAATGYHRRALEILGRGAAPMFETGARNAFGRTLYEQHDRSAALDEHRTALEIARRTGQRYDEATALLGLADCLADQRAAQDHRQLAAKIQQELALAKCSDTHLRVRWITSAAGGR